MHIHYLVIVGWSASVQSKPDVMNFNTFSLISLDPNMINRQHTKRNPVSHYCMLLLLLVSSSVQTVLYFIFSFFVVWLVCPQTYVRKSCFRHLRDRSLRSNVKATLEVSSSCCNNNCGYNTNNGSSSSVHLQCT